MVDWKKGMHVYTLERRDNNDGTQKRAINKRYKYKIRSIGKKQAVVDYVDNLNYKGFAFYLTHPDSITSWRERHPGEDLPSYYRERWEDVFVPAGDGDWDADENYLTVIEKAG